MAVYYTIDAYDFDSDKRFQSKTEVCLNIRTHRLKDYKVYEKADLLRGSKSIGSAGYVPLAPMSNDITSEIKRILDHYEEMEKA